MLGCSGGRAMQKIGNNADQIRSLGDRSVATEGRCWGCLELILRVPCATRRISQHNGRATNNDRKNEMHPLDRATYTFHMDKPVKSLLLTPAIRSYPGLHLQRARAESPGSFALQVWYAEMASRSDPTSKFGPHLFGEVAFANVHL